MAIRSFRGPRRSSEGPGGPDLVPTAHDWPVWVGVMLTKNFDLVSSRVVKADFLKAVREAVV